MVNNREIALFNIEGTYFAIHNRCPHEGGPLFSTFETGKGRTAVDIVWGVMMCRWKERRFLSGLGENLSMMRRRRSGLPRK
ncbi:MAG: Rieske 2Fe-2S domain-containing protein [Nitrospirae bacterium]|nr:MAG: Rieske 2Fe-2S domain-containing protein [Nitrospirota bacterium]